MGRRRGGGRGRVHIPGHGNIDKRELEPTLKVRQWAERLSYRKALEYETTRWPKPHSVARWWAFWCRPDIPDFAAPAAEPDPRRITGGGRAEMEAYELARNTWLSERRAWLEEMAVAEAEAEEAEDGGPAAA
jgi:hypothetical protein